MSEDFKVIIIGGSVAGLTLAHCLDKLGISFEVLEKKDEISPQVGASLGILPNGALILDQLGLFDAVEEEINPIKFTRIRFPDGFSFQTQCTSVLESDFGYPVAFLERQRLLAILHSNLGRKERVHTGQKVVRIQDRDSKTVISTAEGKEYSAHLVVGADGLHSIVRSEMWRHADEARPGTVTDTVESILRIEYACIYGISSGVDKMETGAQLSLWDQDLAIQAFSGKNAKVYWFIVVKKVLHYRDRSYCNSSTARQICESSQSKKLSSALTFGEIWSRCGIFAMTPLEEGLFKMRYFDRLVCIGDAASKMAPNGGQGANMAIEDAASLANALWKGDLHRAMTATPTMTDILRQFSTARRARMRRACEQSEFNLRVHSLDNKTKRFVARYVIPSLNDAPAVLCAQVIRGGERLQFVELPVRGCRPYTWKMLGRNIRALMPKSHLLIRLCVAIGLIASCIALLSSQTRA